MSGFRYHMTFIDEALAVPAVKRALSAPAVPKSMRVQRTDNLFAEHEDRRRHLQVSALSQGSQLVSAPPKGTCFSSQETLSWGSYGHPEICRRPCILFMRGKCDVAKCGFCHLPHETKAASFDKQQREFLRSLRQVTFMEMVLPYVRKQVEENELPGAAALLELLVSEIAIRSYPVALPPRQTPGKIRRVLEKMSLSTLISLIYSTIPGRFPKLLSKELNKLRETARIVEA